MGRDRPCIPPKATKGATSVWLLGHKQLPAILHVETSTDGSIVTSRGSRSWGRSTRCHIPIRDGTIVIKCTTANSNWWSINEVESVLMRGRGEDGAVADAQAASPVHDRRQPVPIRSAHGPCPLIVRRVTSAP